MQNNITDSTEVYYISVIRMQTYDKNNEGHRVSQDVGSLKLWIIVEVSLKLRCSLKYFNPELLLEVLIYRQTPQFGHKRV